MKIEDIIKIIWRRKFFIFLPIFIVPICSYFVTSRITKEYETQALIFVNESVFKHPLLTELGLKIDLEGRLPTIKKLMKGEEDLFYILGEDKPKKMSAFYLDELIKKKDRMLIELKGPGIARVSFSGTNPQKIKQVVERMAESYIRHAFQPFEGIGRKLKEKIKRKDEILSIHLFPKLLEAKTTYLEMKKNFTEKSPNFLQAKYDYDAWIEKVVSREKVVEKSVEDILPLEGDNPDTNELTAIIEPPMVPLNPFKPNTGKNIILAFVSGVALGLALTFIMEFLDHSLKESGDIESYFALPVLGRIPKVPKYEKGQHER